MNQRELLALVSPYGFPQMMLTRNMRSWIGAQISDTTKGSYNHFCWLLNRDQVASQDLTFKLVPLDTYLDDIHIVKFVTDLRWSNEAKARIIRKINADLALPLRRRLYDPLAILGQWTGWKWLQDPYRRICSDYGYYLAEEDPKYNLKFPSPTDINNFQKDNQALPENDMKGYLVTARWLPADL